ncbi:MAG: Maf family protein [Spirochaetaceae bacterium]|nr:Maf family protein [Spirochaetaceae bacterium]
MTALIGINHYYSRKPQALRNLPIYVPSIIAVQAGSKRLQWHDKTLSCNGSNWLIVPANQRLTFVNTPSVSRQELSRFRSTQVTFLAPPAKAMMDLIANTSKRRSLPPILPRNPKLDFAFAQLQEMVNHNLMTGVQQHYLNGFYQQLLEAGGMPLLFPSSRVSSSEQISRYLAEKPAEVKWAVAADTFIYFEKTTIGKPADRSEAYRELKRFSGQTHQVYSGITLYSAQRDVIVSDVEVTDVTFRELTENEIQWYLRTEEWKGVAGSYRIQEKGECLIKGINGSYSSVMGLPITLFYGMLTKLNYKFDKFPVAKATET